MDFFLSEIIIWHNTNDIKSINKEDPLLVFKIIIKWKSNIFTWLKFFATDFYNRVSTIFCIPLGLWRKKMKKGEICIHVCICSFVQYDRWKCSKYITHNDK